MIKNKFKLLLIILFSISLYSCGTVKEAVGAKKRSEQSDEFLVKKKNPLQMPPDMNKLPMPGDDLEVSSQSNDKEVKDLLKIKDDNNSEDSSSGSDLLNNMKKKIQ